MDDMDLQILLNNASCSGNRLSYWAILLREKPISSGKMRAVYDAVKKGSKSKVMGILVDHLMKVAKEIEVPNVYISEVSALRRMTKGMPKYRKGSLWKSNTNTLKLRLVKSTELLLIATSKLLWKNKGEKK